MLGSCLLCRKGIWKYREKLCNIVTSRSCGIRFTVNCTNRCLLLVSNTPFSISFLRCTINIITNAITSFFWKAYFHHHHDYWLYGYSFYYNSTFFAIRDTQGIETIKLPHINNNIFDLFSPFMIIFFAFTGWEIGAHSAEEFKNPKRDFPIAMLFSFLITTILYLTIAFLVQQEENITDPLTPFIGILKKALGDKAVLLVSLLATLIVFANLFGAIWGVSRLVYSLSRDKIIPKYFSLTNKQGTPIYAIILTNTALLFVLALDYYNLLSIESMLSIAGQNFLILYGVASCALFFLSKKLLFKIISITVVLIISIIIIFGGVFLLYPLAILIISYAINFTGNKN
ncbi:APC family permease [Thiothrix subterranea]|uniref:APC family permease n=1 Tax=Thiothrix subterranea TaxID=2735563 RepID=UPI00280AC379|nr:APC family permease [Thiothrix subterranea]